MKSEYERPVPVFIPALVVLLLHAEDKKGAPLTKHEVERIRDNAPCIMMDVDDVPKMDESRGYRDIDPENCWHDWQRTRRELERKPDLDPGPRFSLVRSSDPAYQQTIHDAQNSIDVFRSMLPADGTPRSQALVKVRLSVGDDSAFIWLNETALDGESFRATVFELPDSLSNYAPGDRLVIAADSVLDWMINEQGRLHGGYSLRYQRATLSQRDKEEFDRFIGVTEYA